MFLVGYEMCTVREGLLLEIEREKKFQVDKWSDMLSFSPRWNEMWYCRSSCIFPWLFGFGKSHCPILKLVPSNASFWSTWILTLTHKVPINWGWQWKKVSLIQKLLHSARACVLELIFVGCLPKMLQTLVKFKWSLFDVGRGSNIPYSNRVGVHSQLHSLSYSGRNFVQQYLRQQIKLKKRTILFLHCIIQNFTASAQVIFGRCGACVLGHGSWKVTTRNFLMCFIDRAMHLAFPWSMSQKHPNISLREIVLFKGFLDCFCMVSFRTVENGFEFDEITLLVHWWSLA